MKLKNIIQDILNEEVSKILNEDFKSQRNNFISQINSPNAEAIVDRYLNDFKEIKDNKYAVAANAELDGLNVRKGNDRFDIDKYKTFKELETFVDYVSGQVKVGSANFEDIKVDGKPIYEDKEVEIYYADTPRACIQYKGKLPYSWCVSRTDASNMFYNYRLKEHEPAFYFVKRKKTMDKEFSIWNTVGKVFGGNWNDKYHFFVIQVVKNADINNQTKDQYVVTSAANDGDKLMNWNNILKVAPELNGLQYVFTPKPLTEKEREKINKYSKGLSDEEFAKLPYKEKEYYIAVYVKMDKHLTDNQFKNLPEDLKNKYVGLGVGLSDGQFDMIKDTKLLKRYAEITKRKFEEFFKAGEREALNFIFQSSEFNFLDNEKLNTFKINNEHIGPLLRNNPKPDEIAKMYINAKGDKLDSRDIYYLLGLSENPDEIAKMYINAKGDKLDSNDIYYLLGSYHNPDELINIIINTKRDKLDSNDIYYLLMFSKNPIQLAKLIGMDNVNQSLSRFVAYNAENFLLKNSKNPDELIKLIINAKRDELDSYNIYELLRYTQNPIEIAQLIGMDKVNEYLSMFSSDELRNLLNKSKNPDEIAKMIINVKGDKLDSNDIDNLLIFSKNRDDRDKLINIIIKVKGDKLSSYDIKELFRYTFNPAKLAKMIINAKGNNLTFYDLIPIMRIKDFEIQNKKVSNILDNLTDKDIKSFVYDYYRDRDIIDGVFEFIIKNKNPNTWGDEIKYMYILSSAGDIERIKNQLIQAGVDRSLIPESKKTIKKVLRDYIK